MSENDRHDDELSRLLASVGADADPALWTRARARIEARERRAAGGWLVWWMRPAALGASLAVFAVAAITSLALLATAPSTLPVGDADNLTDALVADVSATTGEAGAAVEPGAATPAPAAAGTSSTSDSGRTK
jgi:hypothetical protein